MKQGLGQYELYGLLKTIKGRQATGMLKVTAENASFEIYIKKGEIIYIHTSEPDRSLPAFLLKAGLVDKAVLSQVINYARSKKLSFDNAVRDLKAFDHEMLETAKSTHQNTLLAFVLSLRSLEVELKETNLPASLMDMLPLDVFSALCRCVAALSDVEQMRSVLTPVIKQGLRISPDAVDLLPIIASLIGSHDILSWIRHGEVDRITLKTLDDELAVKLLFVLFLDDRLTTPQVDLPVENDGILASLAAQLSSMMEMNYYQGLGINVDAPISVVESRYHFLKRKFSASRYEGTTYQDKVEEYIRQIHELLDKARDALVDKRRRLDYNRLMKVDSPNLTAKINEMLLVLAISGRIFCQYITR